VKDDIGLATPQWRAAAARAVGFFSVWFILSGGAVANLLLGLVAAPAATWLSLRLVPPGEGRLSPVALCAWALRFLGQSLYAGADVARRALDPALPLDPGFVSYTPVIAPGATRHLFAAVASLLPGTLPAGSDRNGALAIHCLDCRQPVTTELAAEEAVLLRALGRKPDNG
jgi:multicomponent Na+:H+ antiporter subunit E